jgi:thiamine kinase-like enzyme
VLNPQRLIAVNGFSIHYIKKEIWIHETRDKNNSKQTVEQLAKLQETVFAAIVESVRRWHYFHFERAVACQRLSQDQLPFYLFQIRSCTVPAIIHSEAQ